MHAFDMQLSASGCFIQKNYYPLCAYTITVKKNIWNAYVPNFEIEIVLF